MSGSSGSSWFLYVRTLSERGLKNRYVHTMKVRAIRVIASMSEKQQNQRLRNVITSGVGGCAQCWSLTAGSSGVLRTANGKYKIKIWMCCGIWTVMGSVYEANTQMMESAVQSWGESEWIIYM